MSHQPVSTWGRADAAELREQLLVRLGLEADANDQDIEAAHHGLVDFLELASPEVKSWAAAQTAEVDEAFALLCGPEQDLVNAAQVAATAPNRPADTSSAPRSPTPSAPAAASAPGAAAANPLRTRRVVAGVAAVVVGAIVFGVYSMGTGTGADAPSVASAPTSEPTANAANTASSTGTTKVPVDKTKVAALTKKAMANPKDIGSFQALGNIYFAAGDYKDASTWEQKVLNVDPRNQLALLALGAAQFNRGNAAEAKKHWLVAARLYPNVAEVHFNLGFLYLSQTPPDTAKMTAEWNKVVAIDPTSDLAKTVKAHLKGSPSSPSTTATPAAR